MKPENWHEIAATVKKQAAGAVMARQAWLLATVCVANAILQARGIEILVQSFLGCNGMNPLRRFKDERFRLHLHGNVCEISSRLMWYPALYLFGVFPIAVPFLGILSGALLPWDDRNWAGMALFLTAAMLFMLVSGRRYVYRQRVKIDVAQQTITVERRSVLRRHPVQTIRYASLERLQVLYATNRRISVKLLLVYDGGQQLPLLQDAVWESEFKDRRNLLAEFLKVPLQGPE